jgi:hypothetical protein
VPLATPPFPWYTVSVTVVVGIPVCAYAGITGPQLSIPPNINIHASHTCASAKPLRL